jgi:hypothetical protein
MVFHGARVGEALGRANLATHNSPKIRANEIAPAVVGRKALLTFLERVLPRATTWEGSNAAGACCFVCGAGSVTGRAQPGRSDFFSLKAMSSTVLPPNMTSRADNTAPAILFSSNASMSWFSAVSVPGLTSPREGQGTSAGRCGAPAQARAASAGQRPLPGPAPAPPGSTPACPPAPG